jgi:hypothetical protein
MSYTCVEGMQIEHQETGHTTENGLNTYVFSRMMVLASKHYVAKDSSGKLWSKGVSHVTRTGSNIQDIASKRFSNIVLSVSSKGHGIAYLRREYCTQDW